MSFPDAILTADYISLCTSLPLYKKLRALKVSLLRYMETNLAQCTQDKCVASRVRLLLQSPSTVQIWMTKSQKSNSIM